MGEYGEIFIRHCAHGNTFDSILLMLWWTDTVHKFNELQKQDEMEMSDYTNLQVRVPPKNQTTNTLTNEFIFPKTTHRKKCCELQFRRI